MRLATARCPPDHLVDPGSDPVELAVSAQRGAGRGHLGAGCPVPRHLDDLVEAERPIGFGVYGQDERDDAGNIS